MRAVVQRVRSCSVTIDGEQGPSIGQGLLVLLGVHTSDTERECDALAAKIAGLRIFPDADDKMNCGIADVNGSIMVVSNFTLYTDCKKGRRPSFFGSARPEQAVPLYERFIERVRAEGVPVETGRFGADMQVSLVNDGPVTLVIDTDDSK